MLSYLPNFNFKKNTIHIIGIGGIGMSGLAKLLNEYNILVQGSDLNDSQYIQDLRKSGIKVFIGHQASNITNCQLVVKSSVIKDNNIEIISAFYQSIPVISRADLLSSIVANQYNICVTGSHGKTSITALIYNLLKNSGINPTVICGAIIHSINSNISRGQDFYNIIEADESDGTFLVVPTNISIITNLDNEHLNYYGSLTNMLNVFNLYIQKSLMKDLVIVCDDCRNLKIINKSFYNDNKFISYGIDSKNADFRAVNIKKTKKGMKFDVVLSDKSKQMLLTNSNILKDICIINYGQHNILNTLAAISVYLFQGGKEKAINQVLQGDLRVHRRFFILGKINDITFVDDYAHHPNEIRATLNVVQELSTQTMGKIIAVFEPHKYSRFKALYKQFLSSFTYVNHLIILDIFNTEELHIDNKLLQSFCHDMKAKCDSVNYSRTSALLKSRIKILAKPGDYIIFMGAGNISNIARNIFCKIKNQDLL